MSETKREKQRALVFQGGGALGAYEAGVYRQLYNTLSDQIKEEENIFDIVAGTSIGAINAAIIVSHVIQNRRLHPEWSVLKSWQGSAEKLERFWRYQVSSEPNLFWQSNLYIYWADRERWAQRYPQIATKEAARRYYSAREFLMRGAKNVFAPEHRFPIYDEKFMDDNRYDAINNNWFRYSNSPLKQSIKDYTTFPIGTYSANNEPRLLLVTVDIEEGETVTFDSYPKNKKGTIRYSEYGYDKETRKYEYRMNYDKGLMVEHVMASASVPLLYDFQRVPKNYDYKRGEEQDLSPENSRPFWDGALLSNTPTRELISHHKLFWEKSTTPIEGNPKTVYEMRTEQDEQKREEYAKQLFEILWNDLTTTAGALQQQLRASDLDVYIVNIWAKEEKPFPEYDDFDLTKDRVFDIANHDKTEYDLKVAKFVTDYIELTRTLIRQLAKPDDKEAVRKILLNGSKRKRKSKSREDIPRMYLDLLIGRFDVNEILRIEREEPPETSISNKWVDLSIDTVKRLIQQGDADALKEIKNSIHKRASREDRL
jgi:NTE family protein